MMAVSTRTQPSRVLQSAKGTGVTTFGPQCAGRMAEMQGQEKGEMPPPPWGRDTGPGARCRACAVLAVVLKHSRREEGCCCRCQGHAREREQQIPGDEDQQTWEAAVPPLPAQRETGERVGGRSSTAETRGGLEYWRRDTDEGRG